MPRKNHTRSVRGRFAITLPATSANLGPAFDAAALALSLFISVKAQPDEKFSITASGVDADICGRAKKHLILETYREVLKREGRPVLPLALQIKNEIPIGKGCGSSAAARLAGIALANHYGRLRWSDPRILAEAARREGHLDNVAACWMGGLAVGRAEHDQVHVARIIPKGKWPLLLAISGEALPTEHARGVLPKKYSRADAVANIQNAMLLLAAFSQGRHDLLTAAVGDRIHQPYRSKLCLLLPALQELSGTHGILGVALSGAGPSVLMFLDPKASPQKVKQRVRAHLRARGMVATLLDTKITPRGASQSLRRTR